MTDPSLFRQTLLEHSLTLAANAEAVAANRAATAHAARPGGAGEDADPAGCARIGARTGQAPDRHIQLGHRVERALLFGGCSP